MITTATVEDLPKVLDLAKWFYCKVSPEGEFSAEAFLKAWTHLLSTGSGLIMRRGDMEAIGVILYPDPNDGFLAAGFSFWYVAGDDNSLANGLLHNELMGKLKSLGVRRSFCANRLGPRYSRVEKFLLHDGYRPEEVVFRKDLN
jgi:hypothetical protein